MPNGGSARKLRPKVQALQQNTAALLKLLGGDSDDRLRFWEILKGITTPAEMRVVDHQIEVMTNLVAQVQSTAKVLERAAKEISAAQK